MTLFLFASMENVTLAGRLPHPPLEFVVCSFLLCSPGAMETCAHRHAAVSGHTEVTPKQKSPLCFLFAPWTCLSCWIPLPHVLCKRGKAQSASTGLQGHFTHVAHGPKLPPRSNLPRVHFKMRPQPKTQKAILIDFLSTRGAQNWYANTHSP